MSFWTQNAVIYQIMIDRFAGFSPGARDDTMDWTGGTFRGIAEKVDYLTDLGVNVIWLSPFFKNAWYHGYEAIEFREPDPHFGTGQELKELVDVLHGRGMRVLMDFVPNHCSDKNQFFQDAVSDEHSQYKQWFYFENWPDEYLCYFDFKHMPKLNLDHPPARDYMIGSAEYWMKDFGIDGFRLDHAPGPSDEFWKAFRQRTKAVNPESVMIGEVAIAGLPPKYVKTIMEDSVHDAVMAGRQPDLSSNIPLMNEYAGIFDGALDFNFYGQMLRFAHGEAGLEEIKQRVEELYTQFPKKFLLPSFLDNHDKNRYLFETGQNYQKLAEAAAFQFTLPQPPIIYYGTEVGMSHEKPILENSPQPGGDLPTRRKMNWNPDDRQKELLEFYRQLIKKRASLGAP